MFLNGLKTKSIIRKLEKVNAARVPVTVGNRLKSIGIIETDVKKFDRKKLKKLASIFNVKEQEIQIVSFVKQKKKEDKENPGLFSVKDIGWKGIFKSSGLKDFGSNSFDVLISYYSQDHIVLNTVSSLTQGKFKIGLGEDTYLTHDLSLEVKTAETDVFLVELEKYLKILKLI